MPNSEQTDYTLYYETPIEVDGMAFPSLADYEEYHRLMLMEEARLNVLSIDLMKLIKGTAEQSKLQKATNALKMLVKNMVLEEDVNKVFKTIQ
jgi:hypothetical protein